MVEAVAIRELPRADGELPAHWELAMVRWSVLQRMVLEESCMVPVAIEAAEARLLMLP